jgi:predicted signal transduction protein with EAL and GGDEF domain
MANLSMVTGGKTIPVTVSVGVATAGPADLGVTAFIERADGALYQAKRAGRDRVGVAGEPVAAVAAPEPEPEPVGLRATAIGRP